MIHAHQADVTGVFQPLDDPTLTQRPSPQAWSILLCFDHLNQTHAYYNAKLARAVAAPAQVSDPNKVSDTDSYRTSFWGNIYMFFALNPRWSFPVAEELAPSEAPTRHALDEYVNNQQALLALLKRLDTVDLTRTRIPIARNVNFNVGDCLKILVYHDALHIRQAHDVLAGVP